jgi:hypothetical protein
VYDGNVRQALQVAQGIGEPYLKAQALGAIAGAAATVGETTKDPAFLAQALQVAQGIENPYAKAQALGAIAGAKAKRGDWQEARSISGLNTTEAGKAEALSHILIVWAERENPVLVEANAE